MSKLRCHQAEWPARLIVALSFCVWFLGVVPTGAAAQITNHFDLLEYRVEGNSLLGPELIERALSPHLGEARSFSDVEAARAALEAAYHQRGWLTVLVTIPEQQIRDGEVGLLVIEAPIGRTRIRGAQYNAPGVIREQVAELAEGRIPNFERMQAELGALNAAPDLKATPILKPGVQPGTIDAVLEIDDRLPAHGSFELSNRQSPNTSATRASASLRYGNLFQRRHTLGVTVQAAPEVQDQIRVAAINYAIPMGVTGGSFSLLAVHSRSRLERLSNAPGLGVLGNADSISLRWALANPSKTEGDARHSLTLGFDHKRLGQSILVDGAPGLSTPVHYAPLSLAYNISRQGDSLSLAADAGLNVGLRGLLGASDQAFAARRAGTSANFLVARAGAQATTKLAGWSALGRIEAQWSADPLIGNEQFLMGGASTVRGYLESEASGDRGERYALEFRSPERSLTSGWRWIGLGFAEYAQLHTLKVGTSGGTSVRLGGLGLGLRLAARQHWVIELDAAQALYDGPTTRAGDSRFHARVVYND